MNLKELINYLHDKELVEIYLPDESLVAPHFHITELADSQKTFIDCGNTLRKERYVGMQLWIANDTNHRFTAAKLLKVLTKGKEILGLEDQSEIRMEYQGSTIESYALQLKGDKLHLKSLQTDCLALEECGVPQILKKPLMKLTQFKPNLSCTPGGGCC